MSKLATYTYVGEGVYVFRLFNEERERVALHACPVSLLDNEILSYEKQGYLVRREA